MEVIPREKLLVFTYHRLLNFLKSGAVVKFLLTFCILFSFNVYSAEYAAKITQINLYSSNWTHDTWKGALIFKLQTMPSGVSHFTVKRDDIALSSFLSLLLAAKKTDTTVNVVYDAAVDANGFATTLAIFEP